MNMNQQCLGTWSISKRDCVTWVRVHGRWGPQWNAWLSNDVASTWPMYRAPFFSRFERIKISVRRLERRFPGDRNAIPVLLGGKCGSCSSKSTMPSIGVRFLFQGFSRGAVSTVLLHTLPSSDWAINKKNATHCCIAATFSPYSLASPSQSRPRLQSQNHAQISSNCDLSWSMSPPHPFQQLQDNPGREARSSHTITLKAVTHEGLGLFVLKRTAHTPQATGRLHPSFQGMTWPPCRLFVVACWLPASESFWGLECCDSLFTPQESGIRQHCRRCSIRMDLGTAWETNSKPHACCAGTRMPIHYKNWGALHTIELKFP